VTVKPLTVSIAIKFFDSIGVSTWKSDLIDSGDDINAKTWIGFLSAKSYIVLRSLSIKANSEITDAAVILNPTLFSSKDRVVVDQARQIIAACRSPKL